MAISEHISYIYNFYFQDGSKKRFEVKLDKTTLALDEDTTIKYPDWATTENFRCPNCKLEANNGFCPVAKVLSVIVSEFGHNNSFEKVDIVVETPLRQYFKNTSLQNGISSMLGIMMVASGCEIIGRLKPLLYFHLPFANMEETQIRAFSLYLLSQSIKSQKGEKPDWEMKNLQTIYEEIRIINFYIAEKIALLAKKDASINSIVILNNFADSVAFFINENLIKELESYFKHFIEV